MILWLIYILLDVLVNWYLIEKKKINPDHIALTIFRGWAMILIGIACDIQEPDLIPWVLFTSCSFWVLFDIGLNLMRKKSILYTGENSMIDRGGRRSPVLFFTAKSIALWAAIISAFFL